MELGTLALVGLVIGGMFWGWRSLIQWYRRGSNRLDWIIEEGLERMAREDARRPNQTDRATNARRRPRQERRVRRLRGDDGVA
jgi:hypothetical protein